MKELPAYYAVGDRPDLVGRFTVDEDAIGVYVNPPGSEPAGIAITERGLSFGTLTGPETVDFHTIRSVAAPEPGSGPRELELVLIGGRRTRLLVAGRRGQFQDVYAFASFLLSAVRLRRKFPPGTYALRRS